MLTDIRYFSKHIRDTWSWSSHISIFYKSKYYVKQYISKMNQKVYLLLYDNLSSSHLNIVYRAFYLSYITEIIQTYSYHNRLYCVCLFHFYLCIQNMTFVFLELQGIRCFLRLHQSQKHYRIKWLKYQSFFW